MDGYWKDGQFILASTAQEKIRKLEAENKQLRHYVLFSMPYVKDSALRTINDYLSVDASIREAQDLFKYAQDAIFYAKSGE